MDARKENEPDLMKRTTVERNPTASSSLHEPSRPGAPRVRGRGPPLSSSGMVRAEVDGNVPAFLRNGCSCSGAGSVWSSHTGTHRRRSSARSKRTVTPHSRLVWTNEESDEGSVTTVTFAEKDGKTLLVLHELYPSKQALDAAGTGAADAMGRDVRATGRASRHPGRERGRR